MPPLPTGGRDSTTGRLRLTGASSTLVGPRGTAVPSSSSTTPGTTRSAAAALNDFPLVDPPRGGADTAAGTSTPDQHRTAALLRLAQRGDGEAFGRIYDRYVDHVYRYLFYRVGSHALAEDLTSETFLRALRRIETFSWQGRDIGAWFITIARNLVNDHVKSRRFLLEVPTADMVDADRGDAGIEQVVLDRLHTATVIRAMRELKPEHQECLVLRLLHGLSVAETAEVMGRSDGAVKQLQLRAVRALARVLSRQDDLPRTRDQKAAISLPGGTSSRPRDLGGRSHQGGDGS